MTSKNHFLGLAFALIAFSLALGCTGAPPSATRPVATTATKTSTITPAVSPSPSKTPTPLPFQLWVAAYLPAELKDSMTLPANFVLAQENDSADVHIDIGKSNPVYYWVLALAAPFPTLTDTITTQDLLAIWQGDPSSTFYNHHLVVSKDTYEALSQYWGRPSKANVTIKPSNDLLEATWQNASTWTIVPFESLVPKWKVIQIDGISPLDKNFSLKTYALTIPVSIEVKNPSAQAVLDAIDKGKLLPITSNYDPQKITSVVLTGVTALVRGTAHYMETRGMTYPATDIRDWLVNADILHISNEIPFSPKCPLPFSDQRDLVFCSRPQYIELLEDIGTDVVELSGDHFQDWGADAMLYTIDLYNKERWKYYGGGINLEDGRKPLLIEHNGNKIAFIGCNAKEKGYSGASDTSPGAVHCDFAYLDEQIGKLKKKGYLPIVTFQHLEYYSYQAHPILQNDFRNVAEAGAVIVSGSQAHQPHALEFFNGALLHYGLGNLFFDQVKEGEPQRQAFIDRHIFYNNRHISTELLTMYFIDFARPRPMTKEERQQLLTTVFKASGW